MSDPVFVNSAVWTYFTCDRDPTSIEPVVIDSGVPGVGWSTFWWNTTSGDFFNFKSVDGSGNLTWAKEIDSQNIASMLSASGWDLNTSRSYSNPTRALNTLYTPSSTNDVLVIANINQSNTLLTNTTVNAQIDTGSGLTTRAIAQMSGVLAATVIPITFLVPKGASYKLVASGSGTNTLQSLSEILL